MSCLIFQGWRISISALRLALSVFGTGTFLHNVDTPHVPERKINSKEFPDPTGQSRQCNKFGICIHGAAIQLQLQTKPECPTNSCFLWIFPIKFICTRVKWLQTGPGLWYQELNLQLEILNWYISLHWNVNYFYLVPSWHIIPIFRFLTLVGWNRNNLCENSAP